MSGDYSSANRVLSWLNGTITTQGEEVILPGHTSNIITAPDSNDWAFAGDFCIELFGCKFTDNTSVHGLMSHYNGGGGINQRSWAVMFDGANVPKRLRVLLSTDGTTAPDDVTASWTPTVGTAYDICVERTGTTLRIYVDGVMIGSGTVSGSALFNSTQALEIGLGFQKTSNPWSGRYKAIRVTKAARYSTNSSYVVPSLPLPAQGE